MSTFKDWETYKILKKRRDTNSSVEILKNKTSGDLIVRKVIYALIFHYIKRYLQEKCVHYTN